MTLVATVVSVLVGAILILIALRDITHTLLVPHGNAVVSGRVMRVVWRFSAALARGRPRRLLKAGPRAMLAVVATWCVLIVVGWALVYLPFLPDAFVISDGVPPAAREGFRTALYYSMITLSTLGFGEFAPTTIGMRLASAGQGLIGFVLLTAVISWLLGVFPVLSRQRALAQEVDLLRRHEENIGASIAWDTTSMAGYVLADLTQRVVAAESDLTHTPVAYYFAEAEQRASLPVAVAFLLQHARLLREAGASPELRFHGELLERAIIKLATAIGEVFLGDDADSIDVVLVAWATDHGRGPEARRALAGEPLEIPS